MKLLKNVAGWLLGGYALFVTVFSITAFFVFIIFVLSTIALLFAAFLAYFV
jgi:hypothetical protein